MKKHTRKLVQCPCCGRSEEIARFLEREVLRPGNVYEHTTWSEGKGGIKNQFRDAEDAQVTALLRERCRAFLKR